MYRYHYDKPIYSPVAYELYLWAIEGENNYQKGLKLFKMFLKYENKFRRKHRFKKLKPLNLV